MSHTSAEYDILDSLLQRWGAWHEQHCEDAVLPKQAAFCVLPSDQPAGSRILCADMSSSVYKLNLALLCIHSRFRQALFVWYAVQLKEGGGFWSAEEKAALLDCTENALRIRVGRARQATMDIVMVKCPELLIHRVAKKIQAKRRKPLTARQFKSTSVRA